MENTESMGKIEIVTNAKGLDVCIESEPWDVIQIPLKLLKGIFNADQDVPLKSNHLDKGNNGSITNSFMAVQKPDQER